MNLDHLRYFVEVGRTLHLGRAARALGVTASAVSHAIAALERDLGRELLRKRGRGIALTEHGSILAERGAAIVSDVAVMRSELTHDVAQLRGHFRIAATHGIASELVAPAWAHVAKNQPRLTAEILSLRSADVVRQVTSGETDLGICLSPRDLGRVSTEILSQGRLVAVARPAHPLFALPANKQLAALASYDAVLPKAFPGIESCEELLSARGLRVSAAYTTDSYDVALGILRNTDAWAFLPELFASTMKTVTASRAWKTTYTVVACYAREPRARALTATCERVARRIALRKL